MAGLLTACGGGGGGGGGDVGGGAPETFKSNVLQGRWTNASQRAYVIPSAIGSGTEGWLLTSDLQYLESWTVTTSGSNTVSINAKRYTLGEDKNPAPLSYSGTANLTGTPTLTLNNQSFNRDTPLTTSIPLTALAGQWMASAGDGAVTQTLNVTSNGNITGSSSTGCSYTGSLTSRPGIGVLDMTLAENCASGIKNFSGIAAYSSTSTPARLTLVGTSTSGPDRALVIAAKLGAN